MNEEEINQQAMMDQAKAGLRDMAPALAVLYLNLRKEGLGRWEAATITACYLKAVGEGES